MNCLITCGPTREYIDEVRYISNKSTGVFGNILAEEAEIRGYKTHVISGPSDVMYPSTTFVDTTSELLKECRKHIKSASLLIMNSAVCDYKPVKLQKGKIKKSGSLVLKLKENINVLKELGRYKTKEKIYVGFALEERKNGLRNALKKLAAKSLDIIVLNYLGSFGHNKISGAIISKNKTKTFNSLTKAKVASMLFATIRGHTIRGHIPNSK